MTIIKCLVGLSENELLVSEDMVDSGCSSLHGLIAICQRQFGAGDENDCEYADVDIVCEYAAVAFVRE